MITAWPCGHPRTGVNTRMDDSGPRCGECRRRIERGASRRYRARKKAAAELELLDLSASGPVRGDEP